MRIAIISAMLEEIYDINTLGTLLNTKTIANRDFFHRQINNIEFITVTTRVGKVASAQTISTLLMHYAPDYVIVIGAAGALHQDLQIGDIVIGSKLFQHDVDLRPFRQRFELGTIGKTYFHTDEFLSTSLITATQNFIESDEFLIYQTALQQFNIISPKITQGVITSGDVFFSSHFAEYRQELCTLVPEVLAVEMEGAAIAQVCDDLGVPFSVIRFISDKADQQANIDFMQFITKVAAWYGKGIIHRLFQQFN